VAAIVTGASGGIGRAAALELARAGFAVALHYRKNGDVAEKLRAEISGMGAKAVCVRADLRTEAGAEALIAETLKAFGSVDALVNNAGISRVSPLSDISEAELREVFETNFYSAFFCCKHAARSMRAGRGGSIVNVASVWGESGASCESHYAASKAALINLTKSLAKELGTSNIRVNCVSPGVIDTHMNDWLLPAHREDLCQRTPLGRIGSPADVAAAIAYLCSPAAAYLTGQILGVNGGFGL